MIRYFVAAALLYAPLTARAAEICTASKFGIGDGYHGRRAADGSIFNTYALTAAHRSRAFGSTVTVTNLANGRSVRVRITDRGPYVRGRCIDLSHAAANAIGMGGLARWNEPGRVIRPGDPCAADRGRGDRTALRPMTESAPAVSISQEEKTMRVQAKFYVTSAPDRCDPK